MFVVYHSTSQIIEGFFKSQADADGKAADDPTNLTSHVGDVQNVPFTAVPGQAYFDTVDFKVLLEAPLSNLELLKNTLLVGQEQFFEVWYPGLFAEAAGHTDEMRSLGVNLLLGGWKAVYIYCANVSNDIFRRLSYVGQMMQGASDVTSPFTFYQKAESLTLPDAFVPGNPVAWVELNTAQTAFERRSLQNSITLAPTEFTHVPNFSDIQLTGTDWINSIIA